MNKKKIMLIFVLSMLLMFAACGAEKPNVKAVFNHQLIITGDVENELVLKTRNDDISMADLRIDDESYLSFNLTSLFTYYEFFEEDYDVLFVSHDGMKNKVSDGFDLINLYISDTGWNVYAPYFPPTIALKNLKSVVLIKKNPDLSHGINIISPTENRLSLTPGKMHLMNLELFNYFDGTSTKNNNSMDAYKVKEVIPMSRLLPIGTSIVIMTRDGKYYPMESIGYLELQGNRLNYLNPNKRLVIFDIVGIIEQPPVKSIMDAYHDALHIINTNKKVMVIYIDGFSFRQYEHAIKNNHLPFMGKLETPEKALAVYKPVTNSGMAAMLTGQPPHMNGISDRNNRNPLVDTIFDHLSGLGKSSMLIEGNASILNLNTETVLNPDVNNNGYTDDEVYNSAKQNMSDIDYLMVHFHGLDDWGHSYGDLTLETMSKLVEIDSYVDALVALWDGIVIITSDHGMHSSDLGGDHGVFRYEDMIVPYFITKGGMHK